MCFLVEAFLDMACSVAVFGGGSNKEYALHVLYRLKGNIKVWKKFCILLKDLLGATLYEVVSFLPSVFLLGNKGPW